MSSLKAVAKNTFLYTISSVLQRASSFIFFPIYTFYLTAGDYGITSITTSISGTAVIIAGFELTRIATRLIYDGENRQERIKEIYGTYTLILFLTNLALGVLLFLIGPFALKGILNDIPFHPYITYIIFYLPFLATYGLFKNYLQATQQGLKFVKVDFTFFLLNIGFNLYFVIEWKMGAAGLLLSTVVSSIIINVYAYIAFFRKTHLRFDKKILKEGLHFSLPLIPFILLGSLTESYDRYALNAKLGKEISGIFYISVMMAGVFTAFRESCNQALNPWFFEQYKKLDKAYVNRVLYSIFAGMAIIAVGISWFSFELLTILSSKKTFVVSYKYAPVFINTALVVFLSQVYYMIIFYYKKNTRFLFFSTLAALPVNAILCYFLIDLWGPMGAAFSNFGAMSALTIVTGVLAHKSGFRINHWYFVGIATLSMALSFCALLPWGFWQLLSFKVVGSLVLVGGYYLYMNKHFNMKQFIMEKVRKLPVIGGRLG